MLCSIIPFLLLPLFIAAQTSPADNLIAALAGYPALQNFSALVAKYPTAFNGAFTNAGSNGVTVLAPSNQAFVTYASKNGPLTNLTAEALSTLLSYHILDAALTSANFTAPLGLTIPTRLTGEKYNNRSAGQDLLQKFGAHATGQVVYAQPLLAGGKRRRAEEEGGVQIQGGMSEVAKMLTLDGKWSGGYFHMVDQ
jgi:uncharacterized surface protein with fasciclin (FAS1) repeats